jgi:hypothetical protein
VQLVVGALAAGRGGVEELSIRLPCVGLHGATAAQGWRHLLQGLRGLLERNTGLRVLRMQVATVPRGFGLAWSLPEDVQLGKELVEAATAAAPGLREASREAARGVRTWLLPRVLHPRAGRCSLLQLLPLPLLRAVVELAAPPVGCRVEVEAAVWREGDEYTR